MGYKNKAEGKGANFLIGESNRVDSSTAYCIAEIGCSNIAIRSVNHSQIIGFSNFISGKETGEDAQQNIILGSYNSFLGSYSTVIGYNNHIGENALHGKAFQRVHAFGTGLLVDSNECYDKMVIGQYNNPASENIFELGVGKAASDRQNALTIDQNRKAHVKIPVEFTQAATMTSLDIIGTQGTSENSAVKKSYADTTFTHRIQNTNYTVPTLYGETLNSGKSQ